MARGLSERRIAPFECAALTGLSVHRKFWGCFAAQRGDAAFRQAPAPQVAPTGVRPEPPLAFVTRLF
ncbi:hypothetical protein C1Y13_28555 [Pseudomonas sp. FW305-33]|nr:hypothetical protein C1Y13_28555 [Pseudomonas sp. FW305-33]